METIYRHYSQAFGKFLLGWCVVGMIALAVFVLCLVLTQPDDFPDVVAISLIVFLFFVFTIPSVIACGSVHPSRTAIYFVNWFLGWTVIGWLAALLWALSGADARKANLKYQGEAEPEDSAAKGWMQR